MTDSDDQTDQEEDEEYSDPFQTMVDFLDRLDEADIWYDLSHSEAGIMVEVSVPGEYWEIDFRPDGMVEIERYFSRGEPVRGPEDSSQIQGLLGFLVEEFGDTEDDDDDEEDEGDMEGRAPDIWERYRSEDSDRT